MTKPDQPMRELEVKILDELRRNPHGLTLTELHVKVYERLEDKVSPSVNVEGAPRNGRLRRCDRG